MVTSGSRAAGNVAPLIFRLEEASYLAGLVAGAPHHVERDRLRRRRRAAAGEGGVRGLGQRRRAPSTRRCRARVTYLNNWDDVARGARGGAGADPRRRGRVPPQRRRRGAGPVPGREGDAGRRWSCGANADQSSLAPDRVAGSAVIDLPRAFLLVAREVQKGHFTPARHRVRAGERRGALRAQPGLRPRAAGGPRAAARGSRRLDHGRHARARRAPEAEQLAQWSR